MERIQEQRKTQGIGLRTVAAAALLTVAISSGQTGPPKRVMGEVQSISPAEMIVKTDSGEAVMVRIESATAFLRIAPGETDIRKAEPISASAIATGDRVLAQARANADLTSGPAMRIVVMSKTAIAQKHEADRAEWQRRGIAGTVTAVDLVANDITVSLRGPGAEHVVHVNAHGDIQFRRYAPDSVKFSDAKPSSLAEIKVGDQIRALGDRSEDGATMKAEQVVFGTFHNFPATVVAVNTQNNEVRVNDLVTKKQITVKLSPDSQLKRMPETMAQALAMRSRPAGLGQGAMGPSGGAPAAGERRGPQAGQPSFGGPRGGGMGARGGDPQQMLERMPALAVTELKPGDAVIVASTAGTDSSRATAIALIAGVEPLLRAPREGSDASFANWTLNTLNLDIAP